MSSKSNPSKVPTRPAAPEPLPQASTSNAPRRDRSRPIQSGPDTERHAKKPSIGQVSTSSSHRSDDSARFKVWDQDDTFLPRAKPPPPLPKLDKHRRTKSQHQIPSSLTGPPSLSDPTLPVLDISRRHLPASAPRAQSPLSRSNTRITASSGMSDESRSKQPWRPPPSWAGPHACTEEEEDGLKTATPARSLSRLGSRRRVPSKTRGDAAPEKPKPPEPEVVRVEIVESGEEVRDRGRVGKCPSTGVKIQYYEGWHEKSVEDVVHVLRELKLK